MAFSNIIGHERQKELLEAFLKRDALPHAFLFSGQDGIGKKGLALEFVRHLFCKQKTGCGVCQPCLKIEHGNHPDLLFVESDTSIGIDQSRMITKEIYEHPYESEKRAVIMDRADTMTVQAANALLKTLEEPPPFNVFFLITSSERTIPLTIRSRCIRLVFPPLTAENLREYFSGIARMDEEKARLFASISYGSIGCGLFWAREENRGLRRRLAEAITGRNGSFLNAALLAEKMSRSDGEVDIYLTFLLSFLRDLSVVGETGDISLAVNRDLKEILAREAVDVKWIERSIRKVEETIHDLRYNVNRWLVLENMILHIMR
jgi:DNA polymerase III subunit delta'